jgi:CheY-like chemotaxis protein
MNSAVTIIMIEDDEGHATLIRRNIRRAGVMNEIKHFADGAQAREYLTARSEASWSSEPVLVLLDLNLPDISGIELLEYIKNEPNLRLTPVIILTTTDDQLEIKRCYELGCNVYITKPVDYDQFANAIRQLGLFFSVIKVPEPVDG